MSASRPLRYLSVCSGIEAASVAWAPLGWTAIAYAETEAFPSAVLNHRYPAVPNLGDITRYDNWSLPAFNVLVGGTPCQSFSVAGKRAGLDDARGNLALVFLKIAANFRPQWVVWENVPGVLSIDDGRTFGTFLGILGEFGYGFAYRILDAQYFGVPQSRRRVYVVGYLGDWRPPAAVLFDAESMRGNPPKSKKSRSDVAETLARCADSSGKGGNAGRKREDEVTLASVMNSRPDPNVGAVAPTLVKCERLLVAFPENQRDEVRMLNKAGAVPACQRGDGENATLIAQHGLRRITPRECERLQGFPDDWTLVPFKGNPAADSPRYRAIGNSMAVPVMAAIGKRISSLS